MPRSARQAGGQKFISPIPPFLFARLLADGGKILLSTSAPAYLLYFREREM